MKLNKNVAVSESGLLFNPVTGESFSVNPIGVEILKFLREEKTDEQISEAILGKYNAEKQAFENDYQDFIGVLSHNNLIESDEETKV